MTPLSFGGAGRFLNSGQVPARKIQVGGIPPGRKFESRSGRRHERDRLVDEYAFPFVLGGESVRLDGRKPRAVYRKPVHTSGAGSGPWGMRARIQSISPRVSR